MSRDVPIEVWRSANDPAVIWGFDSAPGVAANLRGSTFDLVVAWQAIPSGGLGGGTILAGDVTDLGGNILI